MPGADGGWVSPPAGPCTSNSDSCAAGQPVLALTFSRTNRGLPVTSTVTVLALAGSKTYPAEGFRSLKLVPSVLPCTLKVSVRAPQFAAGSLSTSWATSVGAPRSACTHCGNWLFVLSQ